jgi:hypothetical protein
MSNVRRSFAASHVSTVDRLHARHQRAISEGWTFNSEAYRHSLRVAADDTNIYTDTRSKYNAHDARHSVRSSLRDHASRHQSVAGIPEIHHGDPKHDV